MYYILVASVALFLGINLGVLVMVILAISGRDKLAEPRPVRRPAVRASPREVRAPLTGVAVSSEGRSVAGIAEPTDAFSDTRERDFA